MAPKLQHLLDTSCYSVTYPPSSELNTGTDPYSPTGAMMSQQHSSPFSNLLPYYPGSQQTLSLDERNVSGSTQLSEPDIMSSSPSVGSDYVLPAPLPPYYPIPLTNNLGIVLTDPDIFNHSGVIRLPNHFPPQVQSTIFSTPIKQRLGTACLPNERSKITIDKLTQLLQKELENHCHHGPDFISLIFPDQVLPIPVDPSFFSKLASAKIWSRKARTFICKPASYSEDDIAEWLNHLTERIEKCFPDHKVKRSWYARNKMVPPKGSAIIRKPDIILLRMADITKIISSQKNQHEEKTEWAMILSFGETTAKSCFPRQMLDTVNGKSYIMFTAQHDRRFVPALCFDGKDCWSLTITDRQGQLTTGLDRKSVV